MAHWNSSFHQVSLTTDQATIADTIYGFCKAPVPSTQFTITFELSCKCFIDLWRPQSNQASSSRARYMGRVNQPTSTIHISITRDQFISRIEDVSQIFNNQLECWPINAEGRSLVTEVALSRFSAAVDSKQPPSYIYDRVWIRCSFTTVLRHILNERREIEQALIQFSDEVEIHMIPAAESSIQLLLEEVSVADDAKETCAICFEEMRGGCVAMRMPCLHMFHGDCIHKWLRTSHYCPVCRFEVPKRAFCDDDNDSFTGGHLPDGGGSTTSIWHLPELGNSCSPPN
ncbi:uncharacterized protein LOC127250198 [Andrographis paniculata]|uniref:uncharacterized protein LOC127250198 n=1 Tax=Andrographis paniculata TaxID=175694 RepID=UPI0021E771A6|nr:uncharacterized protein LOC127250198 [Andrographis paniculata]